MDNEYVSYFVVTCLSSTNIYDINCLTDENFVLIDFITINDCIRHYHEFYFSSIEDLEKQINQFAGQTGIKPNRVLN